MKYCPSCGTQNYNDSTFCGRCGTALPPAPPSTDADHDGPAPQGQRQVPPQQGGPAPGPGYAPRPGGYPPAAPFPPQGGYPQHGAGYPPQGYGPPPPDLRGLDSGEKVGIFLASLCISPIVAIVLYFVWKDSKPTKAQEVCTMGWWVVGTWVLLYGFFILIAIASS